MQARSQVHETRRHFDVCRTSLSFFFLRVNMENRLRCSTGTKIELGRGCLIKVGGRVFESMVGRKGFCYT